MKRLAYHFLLIVLITIITGCKQNKAVTGPVVNLLPSHALRTEKDLDSLIEQIGNARIVLLGEASHGTAEYYEWRSAISKRLIMEKGFDMIAVEGEWADSYRVNKFIKDDYKDSLQALALLRHYDRWPTWMWGNYETASLVIWLNKYNQDLPATKKIGFYGLDLYCIWESLQELLSYISRNDSLMRIAQQVQQCFKPFSADLIDYAYATARSSATCKAQVERLWQAIWKYSGGKTATDEDQFAIQQYALVALNGENYYRTSVNSYAASWNIRDRHMTKTIKRLLELHGPESKIIVWEHNTHIGDARYTDMAAGGKVNVGQLVRQEFGQNNVYIVGFGSYSGTVIASYKWGGPITTMTMPPAKKGSWEELLHKDGAGNGAGNKILFSDALRKNGSLMKSIGHRAIGVQYDPANEHGNYVPTIIPNRYDAFIFIDKTKALRPLGFTSVYHLNHQ